MEPTLDNAMIFGGIGNLRLAPHVREGRSVDSVGSVRPAEGTSESESTLPVDRPRGFQTGEKISISAAAREALARDDAAQGPQGLSDAEQREVQELKARDSEVRAHEQAHKAAGAGLAMTGPTYEYTQGPDGRRYAIGGEVGIDVSEIPNDPEATARKAQRIRAAALAPAEPSAQDRAVAAQAAAMGAQAQAEAAAQRREELQATESGPASSQVVPSSVASAYAAASGTHPVAQPGAGPAGAPALATSAATTSGRINGLFA